jgi:hypothetical protein
MNEELQEKLYTDFPELFQEHKMDMSQTCMCWGLDCGDGWEPIIRHMCEVLNSKSAAAIRKKDAYPYQDKLEVWLHNKCRMIERLLHIPHGTLYQARYDKYKKFKGFGVKFTQIKEKFGTLRVYHDVYNLYTPEEVEDVDTEVLKTAYERYCGYVNGVLSFAEQLSEHTCEKDGKPGKLNTKGWWKTLCADCIKPKTNENTNNS